MADISSLYIRISEYFKDLIIRKELQAGDKMPTEEKVCEMFHASRITVRHAFDILSAGGYIEKKQGKGTFVSGQKTDLELNVLSGFTEEMRQKGKVPTARFIGINLIQANEEIARGLHIEPGSAVYRLERVRCADAVPVAYEEVYLPFYMFPDINQNDFTGSLYGILQNKYKISVSYAEQTLGADVASQKIADLLEVKKNSPILNIRRSTYHSGGEVFEYVISAYRGDMYTFRVMMRK